MNNKRILDDEAKALLSAEYNSRIEFIEAAKALWEPFLKLSMTWEELSMEDNNETADECPFDMSFDEWIHKYLEWVTLLIEKFEPKVEQFKPTVTVKDMKQILAVLEDDVQIVISDKKNEWWLNIKEVELPSEGIFTLVMHPTNDFDTRQF